MQTAIATIEGVSPYSQGSVFTSQKNEKESHEDYEKRCWRERLHTDKDGHVFIPPQAFKNCISEAAKYLSIQIPGKGKATYTKHFESGLLTPTPMRLPILVDDVTGVWRFVPADGRRGGTKRVWKCFPEIADWGGDIEFIIFDDTITKKVLEYHLQQAGKFIGLGVFRPRNNGYFGRFDVKKIVWG